MKAVRALILTGYGLNCDYETEHALKTAGAESQRKHINEVIESEQGAPGSLLSGFHMLVFGGGFSWADDHGAGVVLASKLKFNIGGQIDKFIKDGKLVIGICNGFQSLVNLGLLPGFDNDYRSRKVALTANTSGNFIDTWVTLKVNSSSPCVFTKGISLLDLPVRHGEGNFFATSSDIDRLFKNNQVVMQYAREDGEPAQGRWPMNPNGSLMDIAGICDATGRIFGLMPHPEAFHDLTNHPDWTRRKEIISREGKRIESWEGDGIRIFRNGIEFIRSEMEQGRMG
jgi:phosphoribosylformylglycinamidine synthase subunit PurQ / glutaminase